MKNPGGFKKDQLEYVNYLEKKIEDFSAENTKVRSYYALKKTIDELNELMLKGIELDVEAEEDGVKVWKTRRYDLLSSKTLSDKDDRIFDRFFKFIDKLPAFMAAMDKFAEQISPELIESETYADEYEEVQALIKGEG